jgi:hypothetical protein
MDDMIKYCARQFSSEEITMIRQLAKTPNLTRRALSREICLMLNWRKLNGDLKDMSCRVALLRMQRDGLIELPPSGHCNAGGTHVIAHTSATEPTNPILCSVNELKNLHLQLVTIRQDSKLWNEYIDRYHYLGYKPLPGAQLRYFAHSDQGLLALFGFGAAAWKTAPRDEFIGWTQERQQTNLHLIVNNARFLILPWIQSKHLASKLLSLATRRITQDWYLRYGYEPVLLETFVEKDRFKGTCYRAANWTCLGYTRGRGKLDRSHSCSVPVKSIWVYPLSNNFRQILQR